MIDALPILYWAGITCCFGIAIYASREPVDHASDDHCEGDWPFIASDLKTPFHATQLTDEGQQNHGC